MPDWDSNELSQVKQFVLRYTKAMNDKQASQLRQVFRADAVLHREMDNFVGWHNIIKWHEKVWDTQGFRNARFVLKDATAGILPDGSAKCIVWYEINVPGKKAKGTAKPTPKQIHVESLDLTRSGKQWKITRCFGIGYDPKEHRHSFKGV
jgi:hypothetical protein